MEENAYRIDRIVKNNSDKYLDFDKKLSKKQALSLVNSGKERYNNF